MKSLRIGILGAAKIAPVAVISPASKIDAAEVVAVAARDKAKAQKFAKKHSVATAYGSYEALLADGSIDAIYNPLPNGLHGYWTIKAIEAGKHVLCEKPFTANAQEARQVAEVVKGSDRVVMEAFHWRYHTLATRMTEIIESGEIGELQHVRMSMCFPLPLWGDIRWNLALAGGSMMDCGCYAVSITRHLAGSEPKVVSAMAKERTPNIDRYTHANLQFENGVTGEV